MVTPLLIFVVVIGLVHRCTVPNLARDYVECENNRGLPTAAPPQPEFDRELRG